MAKKTAPPKPKIKPVVLKEPPPDYIRGSKTVGEKYTAWKTGSGEKPDFGKKKGPGDPYSEVSREVPKPPPGKFLPWGSKKPAALPIAKNPPWGKAPVSQKWKDLRTSAIQRRLKGVK